MQFRLKLARGIVRLGNFISSLALMVLRRDDLMEYTRQNYLTENQVSSYSQEDFVDSGLNREETLLLEKLPLTAGRLLVLGMGGGRDAIALARRGFQVVGADYIPAMVTQALKNAERGGVALEGVVQDLADIRMSAASFDAVILFAGMYSAIPGREGRIALLKRVRDILTPQGYFLCQFFYEEHHTSYRWAEWVRQAVAFVSQGYLTYEPGDALFGGREFLHFFNSQEELTGEFAAGGFQVVDLYLSGNLSGAVLQAGAEAK